MNDVGEKEARESSCAAERASAMGGGSGARLAGANSATVNVSRDRDKSSLGAFPPRPVEDTKLPTLVREYKKAAENIGRTARELWAAMGFSI